MIPVGNFICSRSFNEKLHLCLAKYRSYFVLPANTCATFHQHVSMELCNILYISQCSELFLTHKHKTEQTAVDRIECWKTLNYASFHKCLIPSWLLSILCSCIENSQ